MSKKNATKESKKDIWFPAKKFGYGWGVPIVWQGWVVLLGLLAIGLAPFVYVLGIYDGDAYCNSVIQQGIQVSCDPKAEVGVYTLAATFWLIACVMLLYYICTIKGEPAKWRWSTKKQHAKES